MTKLYKSSIYTSRYTLPTLAQIKAQAKKFREGQLKKLINSLAKIDIDAKTGKADLVTSLDLIIARELE